MVDSIVCDLIYLFVFECLDSIPMSINPVNQTFSCKKIEFDIRGKIY